MKNPECFRASVSTQLPKSEARELAKRYCQDVCKENDLVYRGQDDRFMNDTGIVCIGKGKGRNALMYALTYPACTEDDYEPRFLRKRTNCGCFADTTKITMADGSLKRITDIVEGDHVYNPVTKKAVAVDHLVRGPEAKPLFQIAFTGGAVVVTHDHPFPIEGKGILPARDLRVGMKGRDAKGNVIVLENITTTTSNDKPVVWNLSLKGDGTNESHYLIADGIVTGDLYLQAKIAQDKVAGK